MRINAITAQGYRNLEGRIVLGASLSVVVGENNTGKSNLVDALRILFRAEGGPRAQRWVGPEDFTHDAQGVRTVDNLELSAEISELSSAQQARMVTCLAPSLGPGCARLRVRASIDAKGRVTGTWFGGDSDHPDIEEWARSAIIYTYLPALRDAGSELRPGRDNRLATLISTLAPVGHSDRADVESVMGRANIELGAIGTIADAKVQIQSSLASLTGDGPYTQKTGLTFAQPEFTRVITNLRALAGLSEPLEIAGNGLGYNNLLYMAVLLAALSKENEGELRLMLVEEPESHLHPQLQTLLLDSLATAANARTQVVTTSHSPDFASSADLDSLVIMTAIGDRSSATGRSPSTFGLTDKESRHLRKFLDVTKAEVFFARGVIFVEGIAEQLILPELARLLGKPLARSGVTVVNISGVAFEPFAKLYAPEKVPYRCAIVSDSDPVAPISVASDDTRSDTETSEELEDSKEDAGEASSRAQRLRLVETASSRVFLAKKTFEWDLAQIRSNWPILLLALSALKPRVGARLSRLAAEEPTTVEGFADAFLDSIKDRKGDFAQELALQVARLNQGKTRESEIALSFSVPSYLREAIEWVIPTSIDEGSESAPEHA